MTARKKYSSKRCKAMSAGKQAQALRDFESRQGEPTHKRCSKCLRTKPVADFYQRKVKRKSGFVHVYAESSCKDCFKAQQKGIREARRDTGFDEYERWKRWWAGASSEQKAKTRELDREKQAAYRRRQGLPARGSRRGTRPPTEGSRLDAAPLIALLNEALGLNGEPVIANGATSKGLGRLAEKSHVNPRRLHEILHGNQECVSLSVVDRLLVGLGLPHMLPILYPEA